VAPAEVGAVEPRVDRPTEHRGASSGTPGGAAGSVSEGRGASGGSGGLPGERGEGQSAGLFGRPTGRIATGLTLHGRQKQQAAFEANSHRFVATAEDTEEDVKVLGVKVGVVEEEGELLVEYTGGMHGNSDYDVRCLLERNQYSIWKVTAISNDMGTYTAKWVVDGDGGETPRADMIMLSTAVPVAKLVGGYVWKSVLHDLVERDAGKGKEATKSTTSKIMGALRCGGMVEIRQKTDQNQLRTGGDFAAQYSVQLRDVIAAVHLDTGSLDIPSVRIIHAANYEALVSSGGSNQFLQKTGVHELPHAKLLRVYQVDSMLTAMFKCMILWKGGADNITPLDFAGPRFAEVMSSGSGFDNEERFEELWILARNFAVLATVLWHWTFKARMDPFLAAIKGEAAVEDKFRKVDAEECPTIQQTPDRPTVTFKTAPLARMDAKAIAMALLHLIEELCSRLRSGQGNGVGDPHRLLTPGVVMAWFSERIRAIMAADQETVTAWHNWHGGNFSRLLKEATAGSSKKEKAKTPPSALKPEKVCIEGLKHVVIGGVHKECSRPSCKLQHFGASEKWTKKEFSEVLDRAPALSSASRKELVSAAGQAKKLRG
jgi:hypothetical protein